MTLTSRDKRALLILGLVAMGVAAYLASPAGDSSSAAAGPHLDPDSVPAAEQRLLKAKKLAASVPARQDVLKQVRADLGKREAGLIQAETAAQAQAQLLQVIKRIGAKQNPPLQIRGQDFGPIKPYGPYYGEVFVTVSFDCPIEQLVNLLSDLTAEPEAIATEELRFGQAKVKEKTVPVSLVIAGLVPRRLVPEKKGMSF